ncbi:type IV toxin-antitoxin system AbiEi family antitoxin domain-containing protein [Myxococcus faecalis]|uniref:type IV toxin-antitoxin system AbiEi family antitoxin domain-containing protein n=1 Tax=Myxococcus faecalis TaxID=3115646 RepID=UPI003CF8E841
MRSERRHASRRPKGVKRRPVPRVDSRKKTLGQALFEAMAQEQRRVLSDWRALLFIRRATQELPLSERRWAKAPESLEDIRAILTRLVRNGELTHAPSASFLYEVNAPFARSGVLDEDEVLMEVQPFAALSHLTALYFHQLTEEFPQEAHMVLPSSKEGGLRPPGVSEEEWVTGRLSILGHQPDRIAGRPVYWHRLAYAPAELGTAEYRPRSYPVRVTIPERTVLDGLMHPEWCGGLQNVLKAWVASRDTLDVPTVVELVDSMDKALLRQRAGFVLESLGLTHPDLDSWAATSKRGGSSRLAGAEPFSREYSERWNLSLNASTDVLREGL